MLESREREEKKRRERVCSSLFACDVKGDSCEDQVEGKVGHPPLYVFGLFPIPGRSEYDCSSRTSERTFKRNVRRTNAGPSFSLPSLLLIAASVYVCWGRTLLLSPARHPMNEPSTLLRTFTQNLRSSLSPRLDSEIHCNLTYTHTHTYTHTDTHTHTYTHTHTV